MTKKINPFRAEPLKFSIIAPCYADNWKFLAHFIKCISNNDYDAIEIIIVFDGPNAKGDKEAERLEKEYDTLDIKHYTIKHGGAPAARNYGATQATGEIFAFLDPDVYLYPETLRVWANAFETRPEINRVWGPYDVTVDGQSATIGNAVPLKPTGQPNYWAFRFSNFCSGAFPMRREAYVGWDDLKSLQDWDMAIRMLKTTNWEGTDWLYINHSFFSTEAPREGGISHDSATHWLERVETVKKKNDIPLSDICVVSHGAPQHGINVAKILGADYLGMPSFKEHKYKLIYLLGFYAGGDPRSAGSHMEVFAEPGFVDHSTGFTNVKKYSPAKKLIHWIGTDITQLKYQCSWQKVQDIKKWIEDEKITCLTEFKPTHDEMLEMGIETDIVPVPPAKLYDRMPLPKKFTVAIYENATQNMYHEALMARVANAMPDVQFYFFGDESRKGQKTENTEHLGYIKLEDWMPKFSCNLRMTLHDGLPLTPVEFLTAGRNVVTNVKLAGAWQADPKLRSVIKVLREVQEYGEVDDRHIYDWKQTLDHDKFRKTIQGYLNAK